MSAPDGHLLPFGSDGWRVWREAVLRTAGFPAEGLADLTAPETAVAADRLLAGDGDRETFEHAYSAALESGGKRLADIGGDPLFLEAVTWQNPNVLTAVEKLRAAVQGGDTRRNYRRWMREEVVSRYWQRYCGKNETVGFFGPILWTRLRTDGPAVAAEPGTRLVNRRAVFFEHWALSRYADTLAADPAVRPYLPVRRAPQLSLSGTVVHGLPSGPVRLTAADAAVLAACDGRRSAHRLAHDLVAAGTAGLRAADDVLAQLDRLAGRGLLHWGVELPLDLTAEQRLCAAVSAIADPRVRSTVESDLAGLRDARDGVAAAGGDPAALRAALDRLAGEFAARTGVAARHRGGEAYAGRTLCYEETVRDLSIDFGPQILDAVAGPMQIALRTARWLTAALAEAYGAALRELYDDLAADRPDGRVPASQLWFLAQGLLFGRGERPVDRVAEEFARRAAVLFGLDEAGLTTSRLSYTAEELADRVDELFGADAPGWRLAAIHSPDLQICASSVDAINAGDFTVVLGELHAAWPTFDCSVFLPGHDDPDRLRSALAADAGGPGRFHLLFPADWPGYTGRASHCLAHPDDRQLAFTDAPGATDDCLPLAAVTVSDVDGELVATDPDGARWPVLELFTPMISMHAADGFKLLTTAAHTPRLSIDRLVLARETWRTTVGRLPLSRTVRGADGYLAARRMVAELGLPEQVFVRLGTETKPVFVDLTSPVYVSSLAAMLRSARGRAGDDVTVTFSELLPGPEQAWVPDAAGRRYLSELRLQIVDPAPARTRTQEAP